MAMAEPTPGAPGGQSGGQRAATAATFQTNDASLKELHKTFRLLIDDVNEFNKALQNLSKGGATVDNIRQKLSGLGGGAGGGGAASSALAGDTSFTRAGDGHAANGGDSSFSGGSGAAQADGRRWYQTPAAKVGMGVIGAGAAVGGWFNSRMGDISDLNLAYTQGAQGNGMGYSRGNMGAARNQLMGNVGGYQSVSDLLGGVGTITSSIGSTVGSARSNQITSAVGGLAAAMPGMGYAGAAQAAGQLYSPAVAQRMRSMGVTPTGSHGRLQTPQQIYANVLKLVFRGQPITPNMIAEGMQPGAPLYVTLQAFGLDEAGIEGFRQYALTQARLGNDPTRAANALSAAAQGRATSDTRAAGLTTSIRSQQNRLGMAEARRTGEAERQSGDALRDSFAGLAHVVNATTDLFRGLNAATHGLSGGALGGAGVFGGPLANVVQHAGGIGGIGFTMSTIGNAWKTFRGGGGVRGAAKAGGRTALGMSGLQGTPVFVTNWPDGGFGGGGGGGNGNPLDNLGRDAEKGAEEEKQLGRLGRLRQGFTRGAGQFGRGALRGFKPNMGAFAEEGLSGVGTEGMSAAGAAGAGLVGGAILAAPAVVAVGAGLAIHGQMVKNQIINQESAGQTSDSLTNMLHKWNTEGYNKLPGAHDDYERTVKPLIRKALGETNPSKRADANVAAVHALAQLMNRYKSLNTATNVASGKTATGKTFHSMFDTSGTGKYPRGSYSIGQPGGAAVGAGGGTQSSGKASSHAQSPAGNGAGAVIATGESFVGRPYKWGGSSPQTSFDCSGLTQWSYGQHGIKIPRVASDQQRVGKPVSLDKLQPADLVFYGNPAHHVAMYVGGGQMLEAPHTGASIRVTSLRPPDGGARRLLTGRNDYSTPPGGASSTTAGSAPGDSGDGPRLSPGGNYAAAPGVFADESSAFASLTSQTMGAGLGADVATPNLTKSSPPGTASNGTDTGNGGQNTGSAPNTKIPGTVGSWIKKALGIMHLDFNKYGAAIATIIQHESSGNPKAINLWDSNAKAGHPSKGVMQTIDSTFKAHALAGHGDIWNPVDNIIAATRYAIGRYGTLDRVPGIYSLNHGGPYKGYFAGSWNTPEGPAYLHSDEMVVPAATARKVRSMLRRNSGPGAGSQVTIPTQDSGAGGSRTTVTIHAPITVVGKATQQDARDFLAMVKDEAERHNTLDAIGAH